MSECASTQDRVVSRLLPLTHVSDATRLRARASREGINQTTDFFLCMADMQVYANAPCSRIYHPPGGGVVLSTRSRSKDRLANTLFINGDKKRFGNRSACQATALIIPAPLEAADA